MKERIRKRLRAWLCPEFNSEVWVDLIKMGDQLHHASKRRKITTEDIVIVGNVSNCDIRVTPRVGVAIKPPAFIEVSDGIGGYRFSDNFLTNKD